MGVAWWEKNPCLQVMNKMFMKSGLKREGGLKRGGSKEGEPGPLYS